MEAKAHWLLASEIQPQAAGMCKDCFLLDRCFTQLLASVCFRRHICGLPCTQLSGAACICNVTTTEDCDEHHGSCILESGFPGTPVAPIVVFLVSPQDREVLSDQELGRTILTVGSFA